MKNRLFVALCIGLAIAACSKNNSTVKPVTPLSQTGGHLGGKFTGDTADLSGSRFIKVSDANLMISSYLNSINSTANDSDIRSFSIDADSLRAYLSNSSIKNVKISFAHTLSYISAGNGGKYAGYQ